MSHHCVTSISLSLNDSQSDDGNTGSCNDSKKRTNASPTECIHIANALPVSKHSRISDISVFIPR